MGWQRFRMLCVSVPVTFVGLVLASVALLATQHVQTDAKDLRLRWRQDEEGTLWLDGVSEEVDWMWMWEHPVDAMGWVGVRSLSPLAVMLVELAPAALLGAVVVVLRAVFTKLSEALVWWENHRTRAESTRAHRVRLSLLQAVTHHVAPLYFVFLRQDIGAARSALVTVFLLTQLLLGNALELATPILSLAQLQPSAGPMAWAVTEYRRAPQPGPEEDLSEMVQQLAFFLLYAAVSPLAAPLSLLAAAMETRVDVAKIAASRGAPPRAKARVRFWERAAWLVVLLAALVNAGAVIVLLSRSRHAWDQARTALTAIRAAGRAAASSAARAALRSSSLPPSSLEAFRSLSMAVLRSSNATTATQAGSMATFLAFGPPEAVDAALSSVSAAAPFLVPPLPSFLTPSRVALLALLLEHIVLVLVFFGVPAALPGASPRTLSIRAAQRALQSPAEASIPTFSASSPSPSASSSSSTPQRIARSPIRPTISSTPLQTLPESKPQPPISSSSSTSSSSNSHNVRSPPTPKQQHHTHHYPTQSSSSVAGSATSKRSTASSAPSKPPQHSTSSPLQPPIAPAPAPPSPSASPSPGSKISHSPTASVATSTRRSVHIAPISNEPQRPPHPPAPSEGSIYRSPRRGYHSSPRSVAASVAEVDSESDSDDGQPSVVASSVVSAASNTSKRSAIRKRLAQRHLRAF